MGNVTHRSAAAAIAAGPRRGCSSRATASLSPVRVTRQAHQRHAGSVVPLGADRAGRRRSGRHRIDSAKSGSVARDRRDHRWRCAGGRSDARDPLDDAGRRVARCAKIYPLGEGRVVALRRRRPHTRARRVRRRDGPVGFGQVDVHAHRRSARHADRRARTASKAPTSRISSADARADIRSRRWASSSRPTTCCRARRALENVELPMVYAGVPEAERRRIALDEAGARRLRAARAASSQSDLGRTAAARRDRALARQRSRPHPRRRADRRARHKDARDDVMRLFARLNDEQGITIMLVTHEPDVAAYARAHRDVPRRPHRRRRAQREGGAA